MTGNDIPPPPFETQVKDLSLAVGLLTRIPLPDAAYPAQDSRPAAYAAWAYPLIGIVVGGISTLVAWGAMAIGLPVEAAALLAIASGVIVTGAMHEDGLADCADGFWGGWTPERRLEIMKDSQIGSYGVLALIISVGLRWAAIGAILGTPQWAAILIGAAAASRAAMVGVMYLLPHARANGLSRNTGVPPSMATVVALILGFAILAGGTPFPYWAPLAAATAMPLAAAQIAKSKIGGQTGDVLGATQQLTEMAILLACLPLLA